MLQHSKLLKTPYIADSRVSASTCIMTKQMLISVGAETTSGQTSRTSHSRAKLPHSLPKTREPAYMDYWYSVYYCHRNFVFPYIIESSDKSETNCYWSSNHKYKTLNCLMFTNKQRGLVNQLRWRCTMIELQRRELKICQFGYNWSGIGPNLFLHQFLTAAKSRADDSKHVRRYQMLWLSSFKRNNTILLNTGLFLIELHPL